MVKWISCSPPKAAVQVRFLSRGPPFDPVLTFQGGIFFQKPKRKDGTVKADVVLIVCNEVLAVLWQPREAVIITRL